MKNCYVLNRSDPRSSDDQNVQNMVPNDICSNRIQKQHDENQAEQTGFSNDINTFPKGQTITKESHLSCAGDGIGVFNRTEEVSPMPERTLQDNELSTQLLDFIVEFTQTSSQKASVISPESIPDNPASSERGDISIKKRDDTVKEGLQQRDNPDQLQVPGKIMELPEESSSLESSSQRKPKSSHSQTSYTHDNSRKEKSKKLTEEAETSSTENVKKPFEKWEVSSKECKVVSQLEQNLMLSLEVKYRNMEDALKTTQDKKSQVQLANKLQSLQSTISKFNEQHKTERCRMSQKISKKNLSKVEKKRLKTELQDLGERQKILVRLVHRHKELNRKLKSRFGQQEGELKAEPKNTSPVVNLQDLQTGYKDGVTSEMQLPDFMRKKCDNEMQNLQTSDVKTSKQQQPLTTLPFLSGQVSPKGVINSQQDLFSEASSGMELEKQLVEDIILSQIGESTSNVVQRMDEPQTVTDLRSASSDAEDDARVVPKVSLLSQLSSACTKRQPENTESGPNLCKRFKLDEELTKTTEIGTPSSSKLLNEQVTLTNAKNSGKVHVITVKVPNKSGTKKLFNPPPMKGQMTKGEVINGNMNFSRQITLNTDKICKASADILISSGCKKDKIQEPNAKTQGCHEQITVKRIEPQNDSQLLSPVNIPKTTSNFLSPELCHDKKSNVQDSAATKAHRPFQSPTSTVVSSDVFPVSCREFVGKLEQKRAKQVLMEKHPTLSAEYIAVPVGRIEDFEKAMESDKETMPHLTQESCKQVETPVAVSRAAESSKITSLAELVEKGILTPGQDVLTLEVNEQTYAASLDRHGLVTDPGGEVFRTPTGWYKSVTGFTNIKKQTCYRNVKYKGQPLASFSTTSQTQRRAETNSQNCQTEQKYPASKTTTAELTTGKLSDSTSKTSYPNRQFPKPSQTLSQKAESNVLSRTYDNTCLVKHQPLTRLNPGVLQGQVSVALNSLQLHEKRDHLVTQKDVLHQDNPLAKGENFCLMSNRELRQLLTKCKVKLIEDSELVRCPELDTKFWMSEFNNIRMSRSFWDSVDCWE